MNIREQFDSRYLRADDVLAPVHVRILTVEEVAIGNDTRVVAVLSNWDKMLTLNRTNALALCDMYGDDSTSWEGKTVLLKREYVMYQGKRVGAIRVHPPEPNAQPQPQPQPQQQQEDGRVVPF